MEKIKIDKLLGNRMPEYRSPMPYEDIELLARKINEIVEWINSNTP